MAIEQHTYTSCPRGKGYDNTDGFQTKARSAGLTDERVRLIRQYCEHYSPPRSAQNIELELRKAGRDFSSETLVHFPVVISYYPIEDDVYALTRISYVGKDHSGRFGNFFAHTLVFPVEALQPFAYNPLVLARTNLFHANDTSDQTTLPSLSDFHGIPSKPDPVGTQVVAKEPYRGQLAHLLSATSGVKQTGRPVILCFPTWDVAIPVLETTFSLLPREARCRTAFTTYEHDPQRLLKSKGATQPNIPSPLHIVATPSRNDGGHFQFRPEEYQSQFVVLNFAERQYSPQAVVSPYAQSVTNSFLQGQGDHISAVQEIITQMEVGQVPAQWDMLLPAIRLEKQAGSVSTPDLRSAVSAFVTVSQSSSQAATATTYLWPTIERLLSQSQEEPLTIALDGYGALVKKLAPDAERKKQIQQEIGNTVYGLLIKGLARRAQLLMPVASQDGVLVASVLGQLVSEGWFRTVDDKAIARSDSDQQALIELYATGLSTMHNRQDKPAILSVVIKTLYEATGKIGDLSALWARTGEAVILPFLNGLALKEGWDLSEHLLKLLGHTTCPEGVVALRSWRWTKQLPRNEEWFQEAPDLIKIALLTREPERAVRAIIQQVETLCNKNKDEVPIIVAAMWESVDERVPIKDDVFCDVYMRALKTQPQENKQWHLRQLLARHRCIRMLSHDLWLSWIAQIPVDQGLVKQWGENVFRASPHLLEEIAVQVTRTAQHSPSTEKVLAFVGTFLQFLDTFGKHAHATTYDPLLQVAVARLPLSPPDQSWQLRLNGVDGTGWPKPLESRLQALLLINKISYQTTSGGSSLALTLQSFPAWQSTLGRLETSDRISATHWLVEQGGTLGTDTLPHACANAGAILQVLNSISGLGNHGLTEFLTTQLKVRGLVSQVLLLAVFAQLAVEEKDSGQKAIVCNSLASCLNTLDRSVRNAFWEYLDGDQYFGKGQYGYELKKLMGNVERPAGAESSDSSLTGKVSGFVGRFFGRR